MAICYTEIGILYCMFSADNSKLTGAIFCGLKQPGCEVNHLLPSSAEVKNDWSTTSIPPVYRHSIYRDDYTFTRCDNLIPRIVAACHWGVESGKRVYSSTFRHLPTWVYMNHRSNELFIPEQQRK
jgi:hypothetical protein